MEIKNLIENTELTLKQIAERVGVSLFHVRKEWLNYSEEFRKSRERKSKSNSQLLLKTSSKRTGTNHPMFKGVVSDSRGYYMVLKPEWYTGRKKSKHVFVHHIVVCAALGLTEIPKGWVVHHCDENPMNNVFDNLVLMTMTDHGRLHKTLESATTISKESTLKWVEAHGTPFRSNDIV